MCGCSGALQLSGGGAQQTLDRRSAYKSKIGQKANAGCRWSEKINRGPKARYFAGPVGWQSGRYRRS